MATHDVRGQRVVVVYQRGHVVDADGLGFDYAPLDGGGQVRREERGAGRHRSVGWEAGEERIEEARGVEMGQCVASTTAIAGASGAAESAVARTGTSIVRSSYCCLEFVRWCGENCCCLECRNCCCFSVG
jgi:hypothetical protein